MPSSTSNSEAAAARRRQYDERLISMERSPRDWKFLTAIGATALALFALWNVAIPYLPRHLPTLNQSEDNRQIILGFARDKPSSLTLAGTSLIFRLAPYLFAEKIANIALPGQSPVSSANIALQKQPMKLVIEVNILDRSRDLAIEQFAQRAISPPLGLAALSFANTPTRATVSRLYRLDAKAAKRDVASANAARNLLAQSPEPLRYTETVTSAADALDARPITGTISQSAQELRAIADQVEAKGGTVYYLYMPMHPLLAATDYEARSRRAMTAADPKFRSRLLSIDWNDEIRWEPDGGHVDARSALIVARQLEEAIARKGQ
ncbi:hypothetical protein ELI41_23290 [Rhizobium leguminosarum]|uniref:hypothetical protein n=1 Tax=Rhizobium leguminosarum TaxID=384 RepID=UPI00102F486F|nr:hypothetical protein [Rhizobium leguminosarum]TAU91251.1 hypothetical protein ELI41_23290 [Rhizobium leguminosarum]